MTVTKLKFLPLIISALLMGCNSGSGSSSNSGSDGGTDNVESCTDCGWNINQWKITLPVSQKDFYGTGGSSAAELIPANCSGKHVLSDETKLDYFWVADNQAHFKVDLGDEGATTTNSSYVRSEFRELYNFDSQSRCSASNQNWAIGAKTHTLQSSLTINDFPTISNQDPKVIIGQIHGYKIQSALVKMLWEGADKPIRVILNDTFKPGDNVECDKSECQPFSIELGIAPAYSKFNYEIKVDNQGIVLSTTVDGNSTTKTLNWGVPVIAKDGKEYTLDKNWLNETYYFKAGIYPQIAPSPNYANQIFDVSFSKINVTHQ